MKSVEIKHNGCGSGDWYVIKIDDEIWYEGHSIHAHLVTNLLDELRVPLRVNFGLTDEEME